MAKSMIPTAVKQGACGLCIDKEQKRVWSIQCKTFTGDVCDAHMELLVNQSNGQPAAPLFNERAHA